MRGGGVEDGLGPDEGVVVVREDGLFLGAEVAEEGPPGDARGAAISSTVVASYPFVAKSSIAAAASSRRILSRWAAARDPAAVSGASGAAVARGDLAGWDMA